MDTIQLQCGSCGQMMAISAAHLGAQVRCPHCQAVVQTPAPTAPLGAAEGVSPLSVTEPGDREAGDRDSIFQSEPADDLFGDAPAPRLERSAFADPAFDPPAYPPPAFGAAAYQPPPVYEPPAYSPPGYQPPAYEPPPSPFAPTVTMAPEPLPPEYLAGSQLTAPTSIGASLPQEAPSVAGASAEEFAAPPPRRPPPRSMFVPVLLIFLVPYAIFTTAFIFYLIHTARNRPHPLKMLPDNAPKGAARQVVHDLKLDPDMKVGLKKTLRIGELEVEPLEVKYSAAGDLVLVLRAKNVSENQVFAPVADEYLKYTARSMDEGRPYTFLERQHEFSVKQRIYGGNLEYGKNPAGKNQIFDGDLNHGEEAILQIVTDPKHRDDVVPAMVKAPERLLWRVQVRRGLVEVDGKRISATAVVGVDFAPRQIAVENDDGDG